MLIHVDGNVENNTYENKADVGKNRALKMRSITCGLQVTVANLTVANLDHNANTDLVTWSFC